MKKKIIILLTSFLFLFTSESLFTYTAEASNEIKAGDTIQFGGVEWIVLDPETGRVIWNEPDNNGNPFWKTKRFNDGRSNVWETSDVRADLNNNLINDLTFSKGESPDLILNIDLISEDEYIQYSTYYNENILNYNDWSEIWWTKTAHSSVSTWVRVVNNNGSVFHSNYHDSRGVRPALNLEPGSFETPKEIINLEAEQTDTAVTLIWENPDMSDISHLNIYKDDQFYTSLHDREETFTFTDLNHSTTYQFKITTVNSEGKESLGKQITVDTDYLRLDDVTIKAVQEYYNRIRLEWENPDDEDFEKVKIYEEGSLIDEVYAPFNHYLFSDLKPETNYTLILTSYYDPPGEETEGIEVNATTTAVPEVENVYYEALNYHTIKLIFNIPDFDGYEKAALYYEGEKVAETDSFSFFIEGFEQGKEHEFVIKTITTDGYESNGIPITVETPEAPILEEVSNVEVDSTHERVDLSWSIPQHNPNFNFVRIYRKNLSEDRTVVNTLLFGKSVLASEEYGPLFETNGTYFNDLSVAPETDYEYLLTTENINGQESEGITVQASTLSEPAPAMSGVDYDQDEDGDYVFSWNEPTTGTVKVYVGGNEYTEVPASDGQVSIPAEDMKYTFIGNKPDVKLVPVTESGTEGDPVSPNDPGSIGGTKLPITAKDTLSTAVQLFMIVGPFLLLILAIYIANVYLIPMIKKAVASRTNQSMNKGIRRERA